MTQNRPDWPGDSGKVPPQQMGYQQYPIAKDVEQGDVTGGVIPYKNPHALIAYYLGIFSIFPILGLFLGIFAIVLGVIGMKAYQRKPIIKGQVHAWIGIIGGSVGAILNAFCWFGLIAAFLGAPR